MLGADRTQPLEVAFRRDEHARGAGDRLDDHRRDVRRVVQWDDALRELIREMRAPFGLATRERMVLGDERVPEMIHPRQHAAERLAVRRNATHRDAAEPHAVIATLAPDEHRALALPFRPPVGERDLQRGVDRFGAGVREEDVIEPRGRELRDTLGGDEHLGMRDLERRRVVELVELRLDRVDDRLPAVARADAPQTRGAVEDLASIIGRVVHVPRAHDDAGRVLEVPVRRERQPIRVEVQHPVTHVRSTAPASTTTSP